MAKRKNNVKQRFTINKKKTKSFFLMLKDFERKYAFLFRIINMIIKLIDFIKSII